MDDYITMKIKPEVSSVTRTIKTSNNNTIPVVETSEAETTVTIKDGATIVIGGLIKEEKIDAIKKVPLLGDIPILGVMFRNDDETTKKTELVIFLTPKIVSGEKTTDLGMPSFMPANVSKKGSINLLNDPQEENSVEDQY